MADITEQERNFAGYLLAEVRKIVAEASAPATVEAPAPAPVVAPPAPTAPAEEAPPADTATESIPN